MENMIHVTVDSSININGLTKEQVISLIVALKAQSQGYNYIKNKGFKEQKEIFYNLQPELKELSNAEFRKVVDGQLKQAQDCEDLLIVLNEWNSKNA